MARASASLDDASTGHRHNPDEPADRCWARSRRHGRHTPPRGTSSALPAHADDVVDYTLHATLDPVTHTVAGTGTIHFRNASAQPVHELWLHLYLNAFKNDRSAFLRERVGGRGSEEPTSSRIDPTTSEAVGARGGRYGDEYSRSLLAQIELHRPGDDDETDARVPLPRDLPPGASIDLAVAFDDRLPVVVERTGYVDRFHMVGQWFPKIARLEPDGPPGRIFPSTHLSGVPTPISERTT